MIITVCKECQIRFNAERKERKYCSHACYFKSLIGKSVVVSDETKKKLSAYAKNRTIEHRNKLGKSHKGEKAWNWRADKVKYKGLHVWVRRHKASNDLCEHCGLAKELDLANKTGKYKRDIDDWKYLCRKCHMLSDGRYESLLARNLNNNPSKNARNK